MDRNDRTVRATIYDTLVAGVSDVTVAVIAARSGLDVAAVATSFENLAAEHRIVLVPGEDRVAMAHPFSAVATDYRAVIGDRAWWANCAWDAFAILALLGDGTVVETSEASTGDVVWTVRDGTAAPDGIVHFVIPARRFWEDIGFT